MCYLSASTAKIPTVNWQASTAVPMNNKKCIWQVSFENIGKLPVYRERYINLEDYFLTLNNYKLFQMIFTIQQIAPMSYWQRPWANYHGSFNHAITSANKVFTSQNTSALWGGPPRVLPTKAHRLTGVLSHSIFPLLSSVIVTHLKI